MILGSISTIQPDGPQREIPLSAAGLSIGSAPDNDLVIVDGGVAPYHATITCDSGACRITDLGSGAGTLLDGVRLLVNLSQELEAGSVIRIGSSALTFQRPASPAPP